MEPIRQFVLDLLKPQTPSIVELTRWFASTTTRAGAVATHVADLTSSVPVETANARRVTGTTGRRLLILRT
ncbi:MAG: hypothetical protein ACQETI_01655 [Halobacteriota archaeon]